ncbi:MAG: hypothetical protein QOD38_1733 [Acidimicrobiaceae bacterium]|jgi:hypothetical protein
MPADWYEDPTKVGELRYFDGTQWTEHVTIDGVQTTAPFSPAAAAAPGRETVSEPDGVRTITMSRSAQWRTEEERPIDVVGTAGVIGRFVTMVDGAPGYRFDDAQGGAVLSVSKPGLKAAVEVADPAGYPVGTITKVGRLHSRYEIARADGGTPATVRLLAGATDEWEVQGNGAQSATIARAISSPGDALNFAEVTYRVAISAPVDDQLQRLLLATPIAIDILDTQAL